MPTRRDLEALADEAEREAEAIERHRDEVWEAGEIAIAECLRQAAEFRKLAETAPINELLTKPAPLSIVNSNKMNATHRIAISAGHGRPDKFKKACHEADFTQNSLAQRLRVSPGLLSLYRKGKRPIPRSRAERIKMLIGWSVDDWPGGIAEG